MKKFKFNLETVLKIRQLAVDKEVKNLSIVVGTMNKLQNEIQNNLRNIHKATSSYAATDLKNLKLYENYFKGLTIQNENLNQTLKTHESDLNEAREKVIAVEKEMKVIEIIKERKLKQFQFRILQSERIEQEESNNNLYQKRIEEEKYEEEARLIKKPIPIKIKKPDPNKSKPKSEYEKLLEYVDSNKPKK